MADPVQTSSDGLCKLVRWAHSHGTICNLIPSLQHLTHSSYGNVLTTEPGPHAVAVWGCGAGHAYHWPLGYHDNSSGVSGNNANQGQERFAGARLSSKAAAAARGSCDLSCSDPASEGEEFSSRLFDVTGCDSSATDEDGDYEPRPTRKRGAAVAVVVGRAADSGVGGQGKKIKQETNITEDYYTVANMAGVALAQMDAADPSQVLNTHSRLTHTPSPDKPLPPGAQPPPQPLTPLGEQGEELGCAGLMDPEMELLGRGSCATGTTDQAPGCGSTTETVEQPAAAGGQGELERLRALLRAERSRNEQMSETISSLKQDKELLQNELTKKAELICDFLQDQIRPEKRRPHSSNQVEPGSSHMAFPDDAAGFDTPVMFDSFEEVELHPLERHRTPTLKNKRSRDGENTRVRMKNVVGVIARYMAALQEFRRSVSMKVAFDRVGVDRNTISRTAAIAELSLAAPEVFHALAPWDEKEETLAHYAHRCRQAMDDNIKAKIKTMKAKGDLLPIVSK